MKSPMQTKNAILSAIKNLPLLSSSASQVISTINDPNHNLIDLVQIIKHDAALTVEILKSANSAIYAFPREITYVEKAVSLIGEEAIVNISLSNATAALIKKKLTGYCADSGDLWKHNLFTALASRKMASFAFQKFTPSLAFTGGLLHDIGKSILTDFLGQTSPKILDAIDQGKVAEFQEAERRLLGIDHAQAGFAIAKHWALPEPIQNIIQFHHTPRSAPHETKPLVYCVHLSDIIAMMAGVGTGADTLYYPLDEGYKEYIELSKDQLAITSLEVQEEYREILESLEIQ